MTFKYNEPEEKTVNIEPAEEAETEIEESDQPKLDDAQIRAAALAYARFLKDNDLTPGEEFENVLNEPEENAEDSAETPEDEPAEAADGQEVAIIRPWSLSR